MFGFQICKKSAGFYPALDIYEYEIVIDITILTHGLL